MWEYMPINLLPIAVLPTHQSVLVAIGCHTNALNYELHYHGMCLLVLLYTCAPSVYLINQHVYPTCTGPTAPKNKACC